MKEIYKDIAGYEGLYQASNLGNVRSLDRISSAGRNLKGRVLKPAPNTRGYSQVLLCKNGKTKGCTVHQLMAMTFLNHTPNGNKGLVVDHRSNEKTDNRLANLQLISHRENLSKDKKDCSSKYTGVSWFKRDSKWVANIHVNGKIKYLGLFTDELEASKAYQNELTILKNQ